jgi:hypothetical protein
VYQSALIGVKLAHFSGKSSSAKIAVTGHTGTHAPQSIHSTGLMYSCVSASKSASSLRGWMQSTGQTSTQAVSFVPMQSRTPFRVLLEREVLERFSPGYCSKTPASIFISPKAGWYKRWPQPGLNRFSITAWSGFTRFVRPDRRAVSAPGVPDGASALSLLPIASYSQPTILAHAERTL